MEIKKVFLIIFCVIDFKAKSSKILAFLKYTCPNAEENIPVGAFNKRTV